MIDQFDYNLLTLEDLELLFYHECICDGDSKKIIIMEKEY